MSTRTVSYTAGSNRPVTSLWLTDDNDALIDLSTGYTFTVRVGTGNVLTFAKTSGITGAAGSGTETSGTANLTITWATSGELIALTPGRYQMDVVATDGSSNVWKWSLTLSVTPGVPAS